jgi:CubicO group peptidase (beta-lactamase class C family)
VIEAVTGTPLDEVVRARVTGPAGMARTRFRLDETDRAAAAATEDCPWRGGVVQGTVHDENAEVLGGVAGHAGLFSTLPDLQGAGAAAVPGRAGRRYPRCCPRGPWPR